MRKPPRLFDMVLLALIALMPIAPRSESAPPACTEEIEPNNTAETAMPVASAFCITGKLSEGDQDVFVWTVGANDAQTAWRIGLQGIPGQQTRLQIHRLLEPGTATGDANVGPELFTLISSPAETQSVAPELLIPEGKYLVGLSVSGGQGDYRIVAAPTIVEATSETEPNDKPETGFRVSGEVTVRGDLQGSEDWYSWTLNDDSSRQRWTLSTRIPLGKSAALEVQRPDGTAIVATSQVVAGDLRLTDLGLAAGEYKIHLKPAATDTTPYFLRLTSNGPRSSTHEEEPNDSIANAKPLPLGRGVGGRIAQFGDVDVFALPVDATATRRIDVVLTAAGVAAHKLCLLSEKGIELQCRRGHETKLSDLALDQKLFVAVSGTDDPQNEYTLTARVVGALREGDEREPNDTTASANVLNGKPVAGRFAGEDIDTFQLKVSGDPLLWNFDAKGSGIHTLEVFDAHNKSLAQVKTVEGNQASASISDVLLVPGDYSIVLTGRDGTYNLTYASTGRPDPDASLEPNDTQEAATRLTFGRARSGTLTPGDSVDMYRFDFGSEELADISVSADGSCPIVFNILWPTTVGNGELPIKEHRQLVFHGRFGIGQYYVRLQSEACSAHYRISLTRADPTHLATKVEPDNSGAQANFLNYGDTVDSVLADYTDFFRLPTVSKVTRATVHLDGSGSISERVYAGSSTGPELSYDRDPKDKHAAVYTLPPNKPIWVEVWGLGGAYSLKVTIPDTNAVVSPLLPPDMKLTLPVSPVAAFWPRNQKISGALTIANRSTQVMALNLRISSSDRGWWPSLAKTTATIAPGEAQSIPVTIDIEPDTWSQSVRVSVAALRGNGAAGLTFTDVRADPSADPVNEYLAFRTPAVLRGGFNVSATALGAAVPGGDEIKDQLVLHDGLISTNGFAPASSSPLPYTSTVVFGGNRAWPIAGVALNPHRPEVAPGDQLKDFDILLSTDGFKFDRVLSATLRQWPVEQFFVLPHPVEARAAKLVFKSAYDGRAGLGEWKLIADPTATTGISLDLADPLRGGHVVFARPSIGELPSVPLGILDGHGASAIVRAEAGATPQWVLGFYNDRAAQIRRIEWTEHSEVSHSAHMSAVVISVSTESPLGPWNPLTTLQLALDEKGHVAFDLPEPVWARFVKFSAPAPVAQMTDFAYPNQIRIFERATDENYRSILGEWGDATSEAIYEYETNAPPPRSIAEVGDNDTREHAQALPLNTPIDGQVMLGRDEDWFRVEPPADANTLTIDLQGRPTVDVDVSIADPNGHLLPVRTNLSSASNARLEASLAGSGPYFIHVVEPPHSIAVVFDTSGSLSNYVGSIYRGLSAFTEGIVTGREAVNYMPFQKPFILDDWSDQQFIVARAVKNSPRYSTGSNMEQSMRGALRGLSQRRGARAVLLITDAATDGYLEQTPLWTEMGEVRPRVFTAHVGTWEDPDREKELMQDLAAANGGVYSFVRNQSEMDVAFDRVAAWMRRPARYRLIVNASNKAPPAPGAIAVVGTASSLSAGGSISGSASDGASGATELILDASGSMLQHIGAQRKIEIARDVLTDLVTKKLHAGAPLALRVFGDTRPGSCEMSLPVPLGPLDPTSVSERISKIIPKNLARTPIAGALREVAHDLGAASGPRTVIIVTDGEETCGGDPRAEIEALRAAGVDVRVNIVGFAVNDLLLKQRFRDWAKAGGGSYFDAQGAEELKRAVSAAIDAHFRITDANGVAIASGAVNGSPVPVAAGTYRVEIGSANGRVFESVIVQPGETTRIEYRD